MAVSTFVGKIDMLLSRTTFTRCLSTVAQRRCALFDEEKHRQQHTIPRIEKIEIRVDAPPNSCTLMMNKGISTPFHCAMHIDELSMKRSALALLNGKQTWDMHRPLEENSTLEFIHFRSANPHHANLAFWRTGSFLLGYVLSNAFKEEFSIRLCSFPPPDIASGSFVYDVDLGADLSSWRPTNEELTSMSRLVARLSFDDNQFERLTISEALALEMFADNAIKASQVKSIASKKGGEVVVYRMKDHIDISSGPLIASTCQLSHWFRITSIHPLGLSRQYGCNLHRIQGVAIPSQFQMHKWTFDYLADRAVPLNEKNIAERAVSN